MAGLQVGRRLVLIRCNCKYIRSKVKHLEKRCKFPKDYAPGELVAQKLLKGIWEGWCLMLLCCRNFETKLMSILILILFADFLSRVQPRHALALARPSRLLPAVRARAARQPAAHAGQAQLVRLRAGRVRGELARLL